MHSPRHEQPSGRRFLVVLTATAVLAAAAAGVVLGRTGADDADDTLLPPPAAPVPIVTTTPPAASPSPSAPPPAGATARPRPAPSKRPATPARRSPKMVGPRDENGFERLLSAYCQRRGQRTAVLLPDGGDRAAGEWACVRAVTLSRINLDDACRARFGGAAHARRLRPGDARTWRCFDG